MSVDFRAFAREHKKKIILCEVDERVVTAARILIEEQLCEVVLVGEREAYASLGDLPESVTFIPIEPERFADRYFELRAHKGISRDDAIKALADPAFFSCMLLEAGEADGLVCGATWPTANSIRPALHVLRSGLAASYFLMETPKGSFVFTDCAFNVQPSATEVAQIAFSAARDAERMGFEPRIAMLSFSTYGSASHPDQEKMMHATSALQKLISEHGKNWKVGGEMQVDAAMDAVVAASKAPESGVKGDANVFVFPDLDAGNIGYKLVQRFTDGKAIGPIMTGFTKPVNDLSRGCTADEIVDVCCVTAWQSRNV